MSQRIFWPRLENRDLASVDERSWPHSMENVECPDSFAHSLYLPLMIKSRMSPPPFPLRSKVPVPLWIPRTQIAAMRDIPDFACHFLKYRTSVDVSDASNELNCNPIELQGSSNPVAPTIFRDEPFDEHVEGLSRCHRKI